MSSEKSPNPLQIVFHTMQQPHFWIPGFAAAMSIVFLANTVLSPNPDSADTSDFEDAIVNDQAREQLTAEQAAIASEFDDLDVLLEQLNFGSDLQALDATEGNLDSDTADILKDTAGTRPGLSLTSPSADLTDPPSLERSPAIRSFLTEETTPASPGSLSSTPRSLLSPSEPNPADSNQGSLGQTTPPAQPQRFGTPQPFGLPQTFGLSTPPTAQRNSALQTASPGVTSPPSSSSGYVPNTGINPFANGVGTGTAASPNFNASPGNRTQPGLPSAAIEPISPYAPPTSFSDPLAPPPALTDPGRQGTPGVYIGNGEINTFANP